MSTTMVFRFVPLLVLIFSTRVYVINGAKIVKPPRDTETIEGRDVTFECRVNVQLLPKNRRGDYWIYWLHDGAYVYEDSKHHFIRTDTQCGLEIYRVNNTDAGKYECALYDTYGYVVDNRDATLNVIEFPAFANQPINSKTIEEHTTLLECSLDDSGESVFTVNWLRIRNSHVEQLSENYTMLHNLDNQADVSRYSVIGDDGYIFKLEIRNTKLSDAGKYYCEVTWRGDVILTSTKANLKVNSLECHPELLPFYSEGDKLTTNCLLTGSSDTGHVQLLWWKNNTTVNGSQPHSDSPNIQNMWTLTASDDGATIICMVRSFTYLNDMRCTVGPINVHFSPIMSITPQYPELLPGESVTFNCSARANPEITEYTWIVNGRIAAQPNMNNNNHLFTVNNVTETNNGMGVTCRARNCYKVGSVTANIKISGLQTILQTPRTNISTTVISLSHTSTYKLPVFTKSFPVLHIIIYSAVGLLVICIILLSVFLWRTCRHDSKIGNHKSEDTSHEMNELSAAGIDSSYEECRLKTTTSPHQYEPIIHNQQTTSAQMRLPPTLKTELQMRCKENIAAKDPVEVIYAQVNKARVNTSKTRDNNKEPMYQNLPPRAASLVCKSEEDISKFEEENSTANVEGLMYAELDHQLCGTVKRDGSDRRLQDAEKVTYAELGSC
ncbi:uncharacterized protein LOC144350272 [Saccoglossus kowalevskii]